jgi:hypothetical protein
MLFECNVRWWHQIEIIWIIEYWSEEVDSMEPHWALVPIRERFVCSSTGGKMHFIYIHRHIIRINYTTVAYHIAYGRDGKVIIAKISIQSGMTFWYETFKGQR